MTGIANELEQSVFFSERNAASREPGEADEVQPGAALSPTLDTEEQMAHGEESERNDRTVESSGRTVETDHGPSLLDEIAQGVKSDRRPTERYSFEIYSDQIPQIEELQYLYKKRTGQKLSASRILREALETYLQNAFTAMKRKR